MGNCATKPKVLKDSEEDLVPLERDTAAPPENNKGSAEKSHNNAPNAADGAAAAARRSEKGKEILVEAVVKDEHNKRQSLSPLFHEVTFPYLSTKKYITIKTLHSNVLYTSRIIQSPTVIVDYC